MGIIKKQTIQGTVFTYLGVVIGFITTAILFPRYLSTDQIGLLGIFLSYSFIFAQIASLGTGRVIVVFFPYFKDRGNKNQGFFSLMLWINVIGLAVSLAVFFLVKPLLVENANDSSNLFGQYINYLIPLIIVTSAFQLFDSYYKVLYNAVIGIILKEFVQRLAILTSILFYIYHLVSFGQYLTLFVVSVSLPTFMLIFSLLRRKEFTGHPDPGSITSELRNKMISIGFYGILIGFSGMVILNIDRIMVERMMGLSPTGVYTTMAYFATLVVIPSRALLKISDPVISQAWKDSDLANLQDNYYRSSLNQFLIGSLILIGLWGNAGNILRILPAEFAYGEFVILFVGLAFLADMATGTSAFILANSKYFKYQTYFIILLVVFIVITNLLLIPVMGITGAALATFISKILSNFFRFLLLQRKFGLQPYDRKYLYIIGISLVSYLGAVLLPSLNNLYLDIGLRSAIISIIFVGLSLLLKISDEATTVFFNTLRQLRLMK